MPFLNKDQIKSIGLKSVGCNVLISDKVSIYNPDLIEIGDHSRIDDYCVISGKVVIGRYVHIAVFCNVAGGESGVTFADFSGLAYACNVFSQSDDYSGESLTNPTVPDKYKREIKSPVIIGRHSIVGANSTIFPGVVLAEGTSVGANSMVTKSTQAWSVYFGSPAKRLKARKRELLKLELELISDEEKQSGSVDKL
jgi:acetyltransferase-like isoleucine patch superfamily enzyme